MPDQLLLLPPFTAAHYPTTAHRLPDANLDMSYLLLLPHIS